MIQNTELLATLLSIGEVIRSLFDQEILCPKLFRSFRSVQHIYVYLQTAKRFSHNWPSSRLLTYLFTPWRSLSWEANGFSASQEIPRIMEPEGSLPYSQVPATCPYPEPARSSPYPPHSNSWRSMCVCVCVCDHDTHCTRGNAVLLRR